MARAGYKDQSLPGYNQHSGVRPVRWLGGSGWGGVDMGIAGGRPGQGRRQPHHLGLPRRFLGFHSLRTALTASRVRSCARIAGWSRHSSAYGACARSPCKVKVKVVPFPFHVVWGERCQRPHFIIWGRCPSNLPPCLTFQNQRVRYPFLQMVYLMKVSCASWVSNRCASQ